MILTLRSYLVFSVVWGADAGLRVAYHSRRERGGSEGIKDVMIGWIDKETIWGDERGHLLTENQKRVER